MKSLADPGRSAPAFTLIELMAASTVLSLVLLLMVGMQDQMSRAWGNANRRTDVTREARTALRLMMGDLAKMNLRAATFPSNNYSPVTNAGIPIIVGGYSGGNANPLSISASSQYFFGVVSRRPTPSNPSDLAVVGYYIASATNTNVSGISTPAYNLYRYYLPALSDVTNQLARWMSGNISLVKPATPGDPNNEVVARNMAGLRISFFGLTNAWTSTTDGKTYYPVTNGPNFSIEEGKRNYPCTGNRIRIQLVGYPADATIRFAKLADWTNSANLTRFSRVFELGLDVRRSD